MNQRQNGTAACAHILKPNRNINQHCYCRNQRCLDGCTLHFTADRTADIIRFRQCRFGIFLLDCFHQSRTRRAVDGLQFDFYVICPQNLLNLRTGLIGYVLDNGNQLIIIIFTVHIQFHGGTACKFNVPVECALTCLCIGNHKAKTNNNDQQGKDKEFFSVLNNLHFPHLLISFSSRNIWDSAHRHTSDRSQSHG